MNANANANAPVSASSATPESPWLGLRSFTEDAQAYFFGRGDEVDDLYERVLDRPLTILFGQSGLGKSSLLQAALVPRLRAAGWLPVVVRFEHDADALPLEAQLLSRLRAALEAAGFAAQTAALVPDATVSTAARDDASRFWLLFHDPALGFIPGRGAPPGALPRVVFLLDQFEEIFTLGERPARRGLSAAFRETLAALVENRPPASLRAVLDSDDAVAERLDYRAQHARVLLSLREDFLHMLERWRRVMPSLMENRLELRMLNGPQAFQAVVRPGRLRPNQPPIVPDPVGQAIVRFVAGAADDAALDGIDAVPPLLSLVCAELNAERLDAGEPQITQAQFEGHSTDILASFYFRSFDPATHGGSLAGVPDAGAVLTHLRRLVEDRLLSPDGYRESIAFDTIARELSTDAGVKAATAALDALVDRRLLTVEERGGVRRIELAHDVLTGIVKASRDERHELESIAQAQSERERAEAEAARILKERNRLRRFAILTSCLALVAVASAVVGWTSYRRARRAEVAALELGNKASAKEQVAIAALNEVEQQRKAMACANADLANALTRARQIAYAAHINLAQVDWNATNVVHARELLENPDEAEFRGFEWYYLRRLYYPELLTLKGHTNAVAAVAFSPDGKRLASASYDDTVKLWNSDSGHELLTLRGHTSAVAAVAFSPDGKRLASASWDHTVRLWNSATGHDLLTLKGHTEKVSAVAFSPDGKRLASGSHDGTVKLWDSDSGHELLTLEGHNFTVSDVTFSPDGKRLASAGSGLHGTAKLWDSDTGQELLTLKGHTAGLSAVAFSPDGKRLASASGDRTVKLWDSDTGQELLTLKGHASGLSAVAFSPDGIRLASASYDDTVKLWNSDSGHELLTLRGHTSAVAAVAFSPDGKRLASASADRTVKLWNSTTGHELLTLSGHTNEVAAVAFSPDGIRLASASKDHTVKLWDGDSGQELLTLKGHTNEVAAVAFSPDGIRLASASGDGTVKLWNSHTGHELLTLKEHIYRVSGVAFSPDGKRLASASWDHTVKLWDSDSGHELLTLRGHTNTVAAVAFSPDGKRLASASWDHTAKLWDSATGQELLTLKGHTQATTGVAFSPDGKRLASASWDLDGTVKLWDSATGQELLTLKEHTGQLPHVAFSPDGKRLASASNDGTVKLWDSATEHELLTLKGHTEGTY